MGNIFLQAKFGDQFVTKDGTMVIYNQKSTDGVEVIHNVLVEGNYDTTCCNDDGVFDEEYPEKTIIGRWKEPIDVRRT